MAVTTGSASSPALERYEAVIGIEVHCQLKTASKMFCGCSNSYADDPPNTHCCPVCLGLPGALPVINRRAVELVLATGAAIDAETPEATRWDRKNYFYPDLPKGYQISQYDLPLAANGRLTFQTSEGEVTIGIRRAHLEEDTAKLIHGTDAAGRRVSLVDFNRSGAPLMEIVTEPDVRSAEAARRYAEELQALLRAVGASDADMERGQMRVEANVSLRPRGVETLGTRVEVKNMNSFRSVERAVAFEIERQAAALDAGETLTQDTRGWNEERGSTYVMRSKEDSQDYRYFPEPDLPPLHVDAAWLAGVRAALPELPADRRDRYQSELGLSAYDAAVIVADAGMTSAFDAIRQAGPSISPKAVANFVTGQYARHLKEFGPGVNGLAARTKPGEVARLLIAIQDGEISRSVGRELLDDQVVNGKAADELLSRTVRPAAIGREWIERWLDAFLAEHPNIVDDHRAGKPVAGFVVGQFMKSSQGAADAALVSQVVRERLDGASA